MDCTRFRPTSAAPRRRPRQRYVQRLSSLDVALGSGLSSGGRRAPATLRQRLDNASAAALVTPLSTPPFLYSKLYLNILLMNGVPTLQAHLCSASTTPSATLSAAQQCLYVALGSALRSGGRRVTYISYNERKREPRGPGLHVYISWYVSTYAHVCTC